VVYLLGLLLALAVAALSYHLHLLTKAAAFAAFLMGWVIFSFGQVPFAVPMLVFFISSSLLSKVNLRKKAQFDLEASYSSARGWFQVVANGLVPVVLLLGWAFTKSDMLHLLYVIALASATADTWATEIGIFSRSKPRSILSLRPVAPGSSGGVTALGFAAAMVGAALVGFSGLLASGLWNPRSFPWSVLIIITAVAVAAQTVDSVLGDRLQAKYLCSGCQKRLEAMCRHHRDACSHVSGVTWLDNNVVNMLAVVAGTAIGYFSMKSLDY